MQQLPVLKPGDQVGVISPSAGLPAVFPHVFELGLTRLREVLGLVHVEYPTTRVMNAPLRDRARDIMAAFADPNNKAVMASIGGSDQIKLLKYLDPAVIAANPKPFFGYSDNTNLHNYLWKMGIPSFYGGGVMNQLGMNKEMFSMTVDSFRNALFERGEVELTASPIYNDIGIDWAEASRLSEARPTEPNEGWYWDGESNAEGKLWGGCVESLLALLGSGMAPEDKDMDNIVFFMETSEEIPAPWVVEDVLVALGERGWLERGAAVLVGRPKAWELDKQNPADVKAAYKAEQREAVIRVVREYNASMPIIQNMDFGHTDPQLILPMGNQVRINSAERQIVADYGSRSLEQSRLTDKGHGL